MNYLSFFTNKYILGGLAVLAIILAFNRHISNVKEDAYKAGEDKANAEWNIKNAEAVMKISAENNERLISEQLAKNEIIKRNALTSLKNKKAMEELEKLLAKKETIQCIDEETLERLNEGR